MNHTTTHLQTDVPAAGSSARLTGRRLRLLRVLWASVAVVFIALFFPGIAHDLQAARQGAAGWWEVGLAAFYLLLALFIFWRRSDDWVAGLLSVTLMMTLSIDTFQVVFGSEPLVLRLELVLSAISSSTLLCLFYVFPDGRFTPRWTRWAAAGQIGIQFGHVFFEQAYMERGIALLGLLLITAPVAQIVRYFRASDAAQRQQIKWVVFGLAVTVPPVALAIVSYTVLSEANLSESLGFFAWTAFLVVFPLSITVSILRYRLYDIDVIIRKTLVYGLLTAVLGLVYFGGVVLLQRLFGALTGVTQSPLAVVVSTLAIAALFNPVRRRVQTLVDRRFVRRKYDARQVLANFAAAAQDEVELHQLTAELAQVVEVTLQPEHVGVWLR